MNEPKREPARKHSFTGVLFEDDWEDSDDVVSFGEEESRRLLGWEPISEFFGSPVAQDDPEEFRALSETLNAPLITDCSESYCDLPGLKCARNVGIGLVHLLVCCDEMHPATNCHDAPCWFYGRTCDVAVEAAFFTQGSYQGKAPYVTTTAQSPWAQAPVPFPRLSEDERSTTLSKSESSARRLEAVDVSVPSGGSLAALITAIETAESPVLSESSVILAGRVAAAQEAVNEQIRFETYIGTLSPVLQAALRTQRAEQQAAAQSVKFETQRNVSQLLTRVQAVRDSLTKFVVKQLLTNQPPEAFETPMFTIWIGKSTDLTNALPSLKFPDKYRVPSNSPDNPTLSNPVTGFSFSYTEYTRNIFGWSEGAPASSVSGVATVKLMKANPDLEIATSPADPPIRIFADREIFSSAVCLVWDKFVEGTAGGQWNSSGGINDGDGCLITRTGDIALMVDPSRTRQSVLQVAADAPFPKTAKKKPRLFVLVVLIFVVAFTGIVALWSYKADETIREEQRALKDAGARSDGFYLPGDGVSAPTSIADPIAYGEKEKRKFISRTFWNVVKRHHVFIGPLFYHDQFTRPQRLLSALSLVTGLMAVNAVIFGTDNAIVREDQPAAGGALSALIVFPVFWVLHLMFDLRPSRGKRKLVKIDQPAPTVSSSGTPGGFVAVPLLPPVLFGQTPPPALPPPESSLPTSSARSSPSDGWRSRTGTPPPPPPRPSGPPMPPRMPPPGSSRGSAGPPLSPEAKHGMIPPPPPPKNERSSLVASSAPALPPPLPNPRRAPSPPPGGPRRQSAVLPPPGSPSGSSGVSSVYPGLSPVSSFPTSPTGLLPPPPLLSPPLLSPRSLQPTPPRGPPPPPPEDTSSFVRRLQDVYLTRVQRVHDKGRRISGGGQAARAVPDWLYRLSAALPYAACMSWVLVSCFLVVVYSLEFTSETAWYEGVGVALAVSAFGLDVARCVLLCVIEIRKFEIRKREADKAGKKRSVTPPMMRQARRGTAPRGYSGGTPPGGPPPPPPPGLPFRGQFNQF